MDLIGEASTTTRALVLFGGDELAALDLSLVVKAEVDVADGG